VEGVEVAGASKLDAGAEVPFARGVWEEPNPKAEFARSGAADEDPPPANGFDFAASPVPLTCFPLPKPEVPLA